MKDETRNAKFEMRKKESYTEDAESTEFTERS
jgi:hypothetical protein